MSPVSSTHEDRDLRHSSSGNLISYFGKEVVAPHQVAVYRSVISQHNFALQIDSHMKIMSIK